MSYRSKSDKYKSVLTDRFTKSMELKEFDVSSAELFKHQPLQDPSAEFRYLYLLPRTHNIDLDGQTVFRCELLSHTKEQAPRYIGLSYAWGNSWLHRSILLGDKIFHVPENLATAFEHLQEEGKTIVFWVDAVCVDQSNVDEKGMQVQRMCHVFSSAALVIAWLGPAADESDLALQEIESYAESLARSDSLDALRKNYNERAASVCLERTKAIFDRPWFKRVWVGHEVAMNKCVIFVCGQRDIDRETLVLYYCCLLNPVYIWEGTRADANVQSYLYEEALSFKDFLSQHSKYFADIGVPEASDPRDFVYSTFTRCSEMKEGGYRIDYSAPVEKVFEDFAKCLVWNGQVDALSDHWCPSLTSRDLPSWVPDWSTTKTTRIAGNAIAFPHNYSHIATTGGRRGRRAGLGIWGRCIAQITHVERNTQDQTRPKSPSITPQEEDTIQCFLNKLHKALHDKNLWSDTEITKAIFDLTTSMSIASTMHENTEGYPDAEEEFYASYQAVRGLVSPPEDTQDAQAWRIHNGRVYLNAFREINTRNLILTDKNIVGVTREEVQTGDRLYALGGVRGIWVLRKVERVFDEIVSLATVFPWEDVVKCDAREELITIV
ncbi:uncharacterized protein J4E84_005791 [Alternaria hordeiaustralica]|uniref:uncharacterized protein n=1 Tax=Alternaria hordeiaustralica TaxID=1187925 RepID=UPI0020C3F8FE|nr:uncharacterized protein J4E84_005791 [Alternaria hordeiaustralica]KAI4686510.1 hypothetical protein J4E84_005791 [Alternaria hordeiaustralica]